MIQPLGAATARAEFEKPSTLNAPLFQSLIERLDPERRWVVLDLGAAHQATIGVFNRFRCRIEIADIGADLDALNAADADEPVAPDLLNMGGEEPADIVLCWDLLNYLQRPGLSALIDAIALRGREGTLLHALMVYSEPLMPQQPANYVVLEDLRIRKLDLAPDMRAAPRYTPDDLKRYMSPCHIERGVLLANGMQEFLFRL